MALIYVVLGADYMQQKKSEERRAAIYNTAISLFKERGYEETTIRDICDASGVPIGSIYHFFNSKKAFLKEYGEQYCKQLQDILQQDPLSENPLNILSKYYIRKAQESDKMGVPLSESIFFGNFGDVWMTDGEYNELSGLHNLLPFLEKCIENNLLSFHRSVEEVAWIMQAYYTGCLTCWIQSRGRESMEALTKKYFIPMLSEFLSGNRN